MIMKEITNYQRIGDALRSLRGDLKQDYLATKLGISQGYLCKIEKGKSLPTLEVLECYCTFFGRESIYRTIERNLRIKKEPFTY